MTICSNEDLTFCTSFDFFFTPVTLIFVTNQCTARTMKCATHNFFYTQKNQQWRTDVLNEPTLLHFQPQFVFFGSPLKITMKHNHQDNPYKVKSVLPAWVLGSKTNTQWTMLQPTKTFFKPPPLSNHLPGYPCCWKKI